jgi:glycosyltransferase involved in cell wall biosynthesis
MNAEGLADIADIRMTPDAASVRIVNWPRITLVTAVRNGVKYLDDTIRSVLSQNYPNLEYIIVDGLSSDGTIDIIKKYERQLAWWTSERDKNVYDALNRGFAKSSGEIMGWLNASDLLHLNALFTIGTVFYSFPAVDWITGRATALDTAGSVIDVLDLPHWTRHRVLAGANRYIQQESTFWTRRLWDKAGGYIDSTYHDAGDFELWIRFFRHARMFPVDSIIGAYRYHADAISSDGQNYHQRCDEIIERELNSTSVPRWPMLVRKVNRIIQKVPVMRGLWRLLVSKNLYTLRGPDWAPAIVSRNNKWIMLGE